MTHKNKALNPEMIPPFAIVTCLEHHYIAPEKFDHNVHSNMAG